MNRLYSLAISSFLQRKNLIASNGPKTDLAQTPLVDALHRRIRILLHPIPAATDPSTGTVGVSAEARSGFARNTGRGEAKTAAGGSAVGLPIALCW